jgi:hypothetical protein
LRRLTQTVLFCVLFAVAAVASAPVAQAQIFSPAAGKDKDQLRTLNGDVRNKNNEILAGSVVYLKNMKTLTVKSAYSDEKGEVHFHALSPNVDYEVYAEFKGVRSQTKTLSSFDSRAVVNMDLRIDVAAK